MSKIDQKKLILIDGSSYLFRAYHALPPLMTSDCRPTGAIYGVISMIKKLMQTTPFDYIAVVFDPPGKTFRHQLYPEYKANRVAMPEELREQIAPLFELIRAFGLPLVIHHGVEADDVIGTLTKMAEKKNVYTLISTMDKDMAQLVNQHVTLINTMSDRLLDEKGVFEKFGVHPHQIIDYLTLIGDTSDNVPGVPKVGPKTAAKWLEEYGMLDNIVKNVEHISGKVGEYLRNSLTILPLSRELVTIKCDVENTEPLEKLIYQEPNFAELEKIFSHLEFSSWLKELKNKNNLEKTQENIIHSHYQSIQDLKSFEKFCEELLHADQFALDTETTNLDTMRAELVGISLSVEKNEAVYIPLTHLEKNQNQLEKQFVLNKLKIFLQDHNKKIIGQNLKYDYKILKSAGVEITAPMLDTMLESYILNNTSARHDLDSLALKYLNKKVISFESVAGKGAKQITFDHVSIEIATQYAAEDADVALQLHAVMWPKITAQKSLEKILTEIELPLMPILANMEYKGVLIDIGMLKKQSKALALRIKILEEKIVEISGEQFNINSPKQLQEILFTKLKLPILKKTPTGVPSTAEEVMQTLALDFELPKIILDYRSLSKLKSTYTDALPNEVNPKTGRVHTSYNQAVTSTGRLSSNHPNLQNIPTRTEEGKKIRQAFIAPTGYKILSADYSQIELRIMAHYSQDPALLYAFSHGLDVHASTAAEVFGVEIKDVTPEMRRSAKTINFGLLYGMSAFGLAKQLGVERNQAQEYMTVYFKRFAKVKEYMEKSREFAEKQGYVETIFGRRLYVPDINASNHMRKMAAERAAINAPLQGTAADMIKLAMIYVNQQLKEKQFNASMIMQVHDELIFEIEQTQIEIVSCVIKNCMESAIKLSVPLVVAIGVGDNWDEAH